MTQQQNENGQWVYFSHLARNAATAESARLKRIENNPPSEHHVDNYAKEPGFEPGYSSATDMVNVMVGVDTLGCVLMFNVDGYEGAYYASEVRLVRRSATHAQWNQAILFLLKEARFIEADTVEYDAQSVTFTFDPCRC